MYERDIPLGYIFTSPVTYHTVIYHIECDMSRGTSPVGYHTLLHIPAFCWQTQHTYNCGLQIYFTPWYATSERDIPWGTVICCGTSPSRGISQFPRHITLNMVYHGVICHWGRKYVPKWYITLIHWYDCIVGSSTKLQKGTKIKSMDSKQGPKEANVRKIGTKRWNW